MNRYNYENHIVGENIKLLDNILNLSKDCISFDDTDLSTMYGEISILLQNINLKIISKQVERIVNE